MARRFTEEVAATATGAVLSLAGVAWWALRRSAKRWLAAGGCYRRRAAGLGGL